jgi:hypothetical protein
MSFAMLCGPDGGFILIGLILLILVVALVGACLAAAIFATIGLAKWAAARHNRLAATAK